MVVDGLFALLAVHVIAMQGVALGAPGIRLFARPPSYWKSNRSCCEGDADSNNRRAGAPFERHSSMFHVQAFRIEYRREENRHRRSFAAVGSSLLPFRPHGAKGVTYSAALQLYGAATEGGRCNAGMLTERGRKGTGIREADIQANLRH